MSEVQPSPDAGDFERRFGGLRRLYGVAGAQRIFDAHVVVVGIGGVGSWTAEALARSGVRSLTLIDLDHVSESNFNRQVHAHSLTLGQSKAEAMRERIALFHPTCRVNVIDDFVTPDNWLEMVAQAGRDCGVPQVVVDACDQIRAKTAMAAWALDTRHPFVSVGAAGGKRLPQGVEVDDLAGVSHDPLLAKLRYQLRRQHGAARTGRIRLVCVFSREPVAPPDASCGIDTGDGSLNCHGYGSAVGVTAAFGMAAAGWAMNTLATSAKTSLGDL
ncbi:tRNA threonylcarbamoyladenosine dehydratase [Hydrogenophaga crassostreae]|uniref:tRNA threonylcarbamoyladenosine dehydratase n=1 Tax=Hydrogenophaga crassostreae TaxID=1763535 RepID=UPI000A6F0161